VPVERGRRSPLALAARGRRLALGAALAALALSVAPNAATAQTPGVIDFTQVTRPVVEVVDSATIDFLLFELFVEPLEPPTNLQVIDVTQNGFGPDDVMVVFPSVEVFVIPEFIPDSVQTVMSGWEPEVEYRMDSGNMPTEALATLVGGSPTGEQQAEGAILYDLVRSVERSYRDLPVSLLFQRDTVGFTFQLWDYSRDAMAYAPRADIVADSAAAAVLAMLRDVGYVAGANVVGTGRSLESEGMSVVTVERALQGMTRLPSEQMRLLAAQTVLLGSYDYDRSGAVDRALEIDALPCEVWLALEDAFPEFLGRFGFGGSEEPFVGDVMLDIAVNVRRPAYRRGSACLAGEPPPPTDPEEIGDLTTQLDLPERVERFVRLEAAGEILQRAGRLGTTADAWTTEVNGILLDRFDRDRSGSLDRVSEVLSIPCDVWQAMAATHPEYPYGLGFLAGEVYPGDHLGVSPGQREQVMARASGCVQSTTRTADATATDLPSIPQGLREFLDLLTAARIGRETAGVQSGSVRWATVVQSALVNHYDLDGSGQIDQSDEVIAIPCPVWRTIEATYGGPLAELGFSADGEYLGDQIGVTGDQRPLATARIRACQEQEQPG
jgi:hypothetical protein